MTPSGLPQKMLIANRGEIAVRIAATCRSMGIATVAVFSDVDADATHVHACEEAVRLGGASPAESYLRGEVIVAAAERTGADAVHPGYGFLAENAGFAAAVLDAGLTWVGPPPAVIAAMGDKLEAKRRMAAAGVPLVAGAELADDADEGALDQAGSEVGFPLMVKAAAGGGGKGMRVVSGPDELSDAVAAARREAASAFGDERVFLERFVTRPRHVEVQVLADAHGAAVHLFERECSIQRRHQKVIEETPSPGIDEGVREAICAAAIDAATAIGYVNAGTVEFVVDETVLARRRELPERSPQRAGDDLDPRSAFSFLEVNTRLQVEHPVTEEVVRVRGDDGTERLDLVRLQLLVAAGHTLPFGQQQLIQTGHAIEARLYAEDPVADYLPATGTLAAFAPGHGDGMRWDAGVREGETVPVHYDPMLAKVIASAPTRVEAAARLARALDDTAIVGTTTNRDLLVAVLRDEVFLAGGTTTAFLDECFGEPGSRAPTPSALAVEQALIAAALAGADDRRRTARVLATLPGGFTNAGAFVPQARFTVASTPWAVRYRRAPDGTFQVVVLADEAPEGASVDPGDHIQREAILHGRAGERLDLEVDGHRIAVRVTARGGELEVAGPAGRVALARRPRFPTARTAEVTGATLAPMPGSVVAVPVAVGDVVDGGQLLVTVEAMKMEHRIGAPTAGTVREVRVGPGDQVDADAVLVVVEPDDDAPDDEAPGADVTS